jgi:thiamine biosynthesis lipoprotein
MRFEAIGTQWAIETHRTLTSSEKRQILHRIEEFDAAYSRFRDDSLITLLSQSKGTYVFPNDSVELIAWYRKLYDISHGAVSPLVGDTLVQYGYDKEYSFSAKQVHPVKVWNDVMTWRQNVVTTYDQVTLDFGAAGKGFLVDSIGTLVETFGCREYVIDASGDIRHRGDTADKIGLEHPDDPTRVIGVWTLQNGSLCASATNRRRWGNEMHHINDPSTAKPTTNIKATWVVAENTLIADGLSTALFFCDYETLRSLAPFEYVRLWGDNTIDYSSGFVGELFI